MLSDAEIGNVDTTSLYGILWLLYDFKTSIAI